MSISAWPSIEPSRPLSASARASSTSCCVRKSRNSSASRTIISGPPTNSPSANCQPEQHPHDDPELDHQVGGGDLEHHRRGEVRALAKQRAGERDRRVRAARRGRAETGRDEQRLRRVVGQQPAHLAASRRPPAPPPRARSRGSAPTGPPRSSRTRTRAHATTRARCSSRAAPSVSSRSGVPPRAAPRSWSRRLFRRRMPGHRRRSA